MRQVEIRLIENVIVRPVDGGPATIVHVFERADGERLEARWPLRFYPEMRDLPIGYVATLDEIEPSDYIPRRPD